MNKEFRIGDIFIKKTVRGIPKSEEDLTENVQGYHVFGQNIKYQYSYKVLWDDKYLTRVDSNYPILAYTSSVGEIGIITESFYRTGDNGAFQGLFPRTKIKLMAMLYILACLQKRFTVFDYSTSMANIVGLTLELPVIEHADSNHEYTVDDIDWQYMEDRIKELEEDRIKELDAYLKATNLDDYELTDEDEKVLSLSRKSSPNENGSLETDCKKGTLRFKKFRIGSLFDVHPTKSYKLKNRELFATRGNTPVLSNSSTNNGIGGYCGLEPTEEGKIITFSDTTTGADTMFYQKESFIGYSHVQGMYPYNSFVWNEKRYLYLISAIRKSAGNGWSYAVKFNRALVCELMVELPVTADGEPDFGYMERYIRAIEKLTIANVVKYKDKVIDTTKMLVNSQS